MCCSNGKVRLPDIESPPQPLQALVSGHHPESKHFLHNIRKYNSCFQMTSFGANQVRLPGFMPIFKVSGQIYHIIGSLLPSEEDHKFLQIYFIGDSTNQAQQRCKCIDDVNYNIVHDIQETDYLPLSCPFMCTLRHRNSRLKNYAKYAWVRLKNTPFGFKTH